MKLTFAGLLVVASAGYIVLSGFGPKQDQQKQEIAAAITAQLDELRVQKEEECTAQVMAEAQRRYDEYVASLPAEPVKGVKTPGKKKTTVKKDPLPQTKPAETQTTRSRGDAVDPNTENRKRGDAVDPNAKDPNAPSSNRRRGDAVKKEGGGR